MHGDGRDRDQHADDERGDVAQDPSQDPRTGRSRDRLRCRAQGALGQPVELRAPDLVADVVRQREERTVDLDLGGVRLHGPDLRVREVLGHDHRGELVVRHDERGHRTVGVHAPERVVVAGRAQCPQALAHPRLRHRAPVDLRDVPRVAELGTVGRNRREERGVHRHPVGLDVVGVSVAAELVVGHQHLRPDLTDDLDEQVRGREQVRAPEGALLDVLAGDGVAVLVPGHPAVAEVAGAAEEPVVGDPELLHGVGELGDAVPAQAVLLVRGEVCEVGDQHLPLLAEGAGHQRDLRAPCDVLRHRGALTDRLVVGMGVHEQHPLVHGATLGRAEMALHAAGRGGEVQRGDGCRRRVGGCVVDPAVVLLDEDLDHARRARR